MASQGQRFRRKALRRGYKVDEVDAFLDLVEATLDGQPVGKALQSTTAAVFGKTYLRAITGNLDLEGGSKFSDPPTISKYIDELHWDKLIDHPLRTRDNIGAERFPIASVRGLKAYRKANKLSEYSTTEATVWSLLQRGRPGS